MLKNFFEILFSIFAVYGGYCIVINVFYLLFCKNKSRICIAYIADKENNNFSEIFLAKKAFLGRTRVIICVDCELGENTLKEVQKEVSGTTVYRTERIEDFAR